jgi:hypothetical protein
MTSTAVALAGELGPHPRGPRTSGVRPLRLLAAPRPRMSVKI